MRIDIRGSSSASLAWTTYRGIYKIITVTGCSKKHAGYADLVSATLTSSRTAWISSASSFWSNPEGFPCFTKTRSTVTIY